MAANKVTISTPGPAGDAGVNFKGVWESDVQYFARDVIRYIPDGNLYSCTATVPTTGSDAYASPLNINYWTLFIPVYISDSKDWATNDRYTIFTDELGNTGYSSRHHALQSKDWASLTGDLIRNDANDADVDYSSKEYAIGTTVPAGSSKEWATTTGSTVDGSDYSSKEYATGTSVPTGSSKEWATNAGSAEVATGEGYSAKAYAQDDTNDIGSAKDWAVKAGLVNSVDYSSKEYASGATAVSSKKWAIGGGASFDRDTAVSGTDYSAKYYAYQASLEEAATSDDLTDTQNLALADYNTTFSLTSSNGGTTGLYSAKHYATEAGTSASNAADSESASSDDATDANNLAVAAHNTTFNLTASNGGTTGLYSALHYATEAASSESASSDDVTDAQKLAVNAHNTSFDLTASNGGDTGLYSALHYATEAASSASAASTSEGNAATSEGNAATSAGEAEDSNLTAQSYAVDTGAVTKTFTGGTGSNTTDYSAKEWAIGTTVPDGSAKTWAEAAAASAAAAGDAPIIFAIALG